MLLIFSIFVRHEWRPQNNAIQHSDQSLAVPNEWYLSNLISPHLSRKTMKELPLRSSLRIRQTRFVSSRQNSIENIETDQLKYEKLCYKKKRILDNFLRMNSFLDSEKLLLLKEKTGLSKKNIYEYFTK